MVRATRVRKHRRSKPMGGKTNVKSHIRKLKIKRADLFSVSDILGDTKDEYDEALEDLKNECASETATKKINKLQNSLDKTFFKVNSRVSRVGREIDKLDD